MAKRPPVTTNLPAEPVAGAVPPPGAPRETSQPLQPGAGGIIFADGTVMSPADRARQNSRELAPLVFPEHTSTPVAESAVTGKSPDGLDPFYARQAALGQPPVGPLAAAAVPAVGVPTPDVAGASSTKILRRSRRLAVSALERPPVPEAITGPTDTTTAGVSGIAPGPAEITPDRTTTAAQDVPMPPAVPAGPPPLTEADRQRMPAASNTDSPARGVLRHPLPPGKEITGGFGAPASLQYFGLNGKELLVLLDGLMGQLYARCENDLRFNEALVYPRVAVRVVVEVQGFTRDVDFQVPQVLLPTTDAASKNPIDFCRTIADEIAFVLIQEHREVDDAGVTITPPGQIRDDLGLPQPGKRMVRTATGTTFVDVE